MGCVYIATNRVTGKSYIGKTKHSMESRRRQHESSARAGLRKIFATALRRYGTDAFEWRVVMWTSDEVLLNEAENFLIKRYGTRYPYGYNAIGGNDME